MAAHYNTKDLVEDSGKGFPLSASGKTENLSFKKKLIYSFLFLAVLGLCCGVWTFSSCGAQTL